MTGGWSGVHVTSEVNAHIKGPHFTSEIGTECDTLRRPHYDTRVVDQVASGHISCEFLPRRPSFRKQRGSFVRHGVYPCMAGPWCSIEAALCFACLISSAVGKTFLFAFLCPCL